MAYELDANGYLDVDQLTLEEKREIYAKFEDILNNLSDKFWAGVGDTVSSDDLSEEELSEKLDSFPESRIWTDYFIFNRDDCEMLQIVEGLSVYVGGPAIAQGYREQENVTGYIFASESPASITSVFYSAECECPLCWQGSTDDGECEICNGSGRWEWMS